MNVPVENPSNLFGNYINGEQYCLSSMYFMRLLHSYYTAINNIPDPNDILCLAIKNAFYEYHKDCNAGIWSDTQSHKLEECTNDECPQHHVYM